MTGIQYLKSLISGQEFSETPIQKTELITLLAMLERDAASAPAAHHSAYVERELAMAEAVKNCHKLTDADHQKWQSLVTNDQLVSAIKEFRRLTGVSLKQAHDTVRYYQTRGEVKFFW